MIIPQCHSPYTMFTETTSLHCMLSPVIQFKTDTRYSSVDIPGTARWSLHNIGALTLHYNCISPLHAVTCLAGQIQPPGTARWSIHNIRAQTPHCGSIFPLHATCIRDLTLHSDCVPPTPVTQVKTNTPGTGVVLRGGHAARHTGTPLFKPSALKTKQH